MSERTVEPTRITQGEQIEWSRVFEDYSTDEYTLEYRFRGPGAGFDLATTIDGPDFVATLTTVLTAAMTAGTWKWQAWATNTGTAELFMVRNGVIRVEAGFANNGTTTVETRSTAQITLEALDAMIQGRASQSQIEYEISTPSGTRKVKSIPPTELLSLRKYYAGLVARENAAERSKNTGKWGRRVELRVYDND